MTRADITSSDIDSAISRLDKGWRHFLRETPLWQLSGQAMGVDCAQVWLKLEHQQVGGSFKARGMTAAISMAKELGVRKLAVPSAGNAAGALSNRRIRLREVKADLAGQVNELLIKAIDQQKLDLALTPDDQKRLTSYLVSQGYLDSTTRTYKAFANRGEGDPYQLAQLLQAGFGNRLRSVPAIEGTTAAPIFQPIGGMDQISKGFQRAIGPKRITFNAEIQSVHQSDTGVKVVYLDTKSGKKVETSADFVVVSMPLNIVAGLEEPSEGQVFFDADDVTDVPPHRREVAMVFQSYALWPHMNVAKNVAFGLEERGVDREEIEERVRGELPGAQVHTHLEPVEDPRSHNDGPGGMALGDWRD